MSPEEIQAMAKGLAEGQAVWYVLSAIIGGLITGAGAYWAEKGKNRATKEDIGKITTAVEAVKLDFNKQLEDLKAHHQLRMVAAERRMQAHQDAYHLLNALMNVRNEPIEGWSESLRTANEWFNKNNFFLAAKSRTLFSDVLFTFEVYRLGRERNQNFNSELKKGMTAAISVLQEEVELPQLGGGESVAVEDLPL